MGEKTEKKRLAILRILQEANGPLGSSKITERLLAAHHEISERTVRLHLSNMDQEGNKKAWYDRLTATVVMVCVPAAAEPEG